MEENPSMPQVPEREFSIEEFDILSPEIPDPSRKARAKEDIGPDTEPQTDRNNDCLSAKTLQSWSVCPLKGKFLLTKTPGMPLSGYGREIQKDGLAFEKALISQKTKVQSLISECLGEFFESPPTDLEIVVLETTTGKLDSPQKNWEAHLDAIQIRCQSPAPALFYQITIFHSSSMGEELGAIDLLLWTGKTFLLGEIKLTSSVREQTAFQLIFYQEFLREIAGIQTEDTCFVLHCKEGWIYNRNQSEKRRKESIENTQILPFKLSLKAKKYIGLYTEISNFQTLATVEKITCPSNKEAKHVATCWECAYRDRCHEKFLEEEGNPTIDMAGLAESEIEILRRLKLHTCKETLENLDKLERIHGNHPQKIESLKNRLNKTILLGGFSTWASPVNKAFSPILDEKILLFCQEIVPEKDGEPQRIIPHWMNATQPIPQRNPPETEKGKTPQFLFTFNQVEMDGARAQWHQTYNQKNFISLAPCILEREITARVWFPFPSLTLRGLTLCLEGITQQGSWYAFAKSEAYRDFIKDPGSDSSIPRYELLWRLFQSLQMLQKLTTA